VIGYVSAEVKAINAAVVSRGAILKVIFENDYLEDAHILRLCEICTQHACLRQDIHRLRFVRQDNGMYAYKALLITPGADARSLPRDGAVKAAGGVRTLDDLLRVRSLALPASAPPLPSYP